MKLTKRFVDKIDIPTSTSDGKTSQVFYRDSSIPGFALRVTSGGAKSFIIEKRIDGKVKRKTLGKYGAITVEQARTLAQAYTGKIAMGQNPIAEEKENNAFNITLEEVFNDYLCTKKNLKPETIKDYRRHLDSSFSAWKNKRMTSITKELVEKRHAELGKNSPARANGAMRVLRLLFNYVMKKYDDRNGNPIIKVNPVDRLNNSKAWYVVKRKETLIKTHQLKNWYEAVISLHQPVTKNYILFVLFNGLRRTEAATLLWENVDFNDRTFSLIDTKNRSTHTLPMSDQVHEILKKLWDIRKNEWVFPSPINDSYLKDPKEAILKIREESGIYFSLHDLRRTFATTAEGLDISAYALKRLINHKDPNDVTASYIISSVDRLREPIQKIADYFEQQFTGSP